MHGLRGTDLSTPPVEVKSARLFAKNHPPVERDKYYVVTPAIEALWRDHPEVWSFDTAPWGRGVANVVDATLEGGPFVISNCCFELPLGELVTDRRAAAQAEAAREAQAVAELDALEAAELAKENDAGEERAFVSEAEKEAKRELQKREIEVRRMEVQRKAMQDEMDGTAAALALEARELAKAEEMRTMSLAQRQERDYVKQLKADIVREACCSLFILLGSCRASFALCVGWSDCPKEDRPGKAGRGNGHRGRNRPRIRRSTRRANGPSAAGFAHRPPLPRFAENHPQQRGDDHLWQLPSARLASRVVL